MVNKPSQGLPNTLYLSLVTVDATQDVPLYRQIYHGLRTAIEDGRLATQTKLPSTRDLATIWGVSRNTLRNAFDQLIAEGYLEAIVGRGTYVTFQPLSNHSSAVHSPKPAKRIRPISVIGRHMEPLGRTAKQSSLSATAFSIGAPGFDIFPYKVWNRIINRCQRRTSPFATQVNGLMKLRTAIASYLTSARGVNCSPEQIDIVPGAVNGIHMISLAVLSPGNLAWAEEPGYINVNAIIQYRGAKLVPVPVDCEGIDVPTGIARAPDARLAYVTPSHQYPLGVTMSLNRRHQLLDWAATANAWIIEDDYDSEFRYDGLPLMALQGLDNQQRVIYCGSFSKVMLQSLRLGYVVLPSDLVDVYTGVKIPFELHSSTLIQEAMAEFMLEGHFVRHIRRMRKHYRARRDALVTAVTRHLDGAITLGARDCGMHTVGYLAEQFDEATVVNKARALGMAIAPLSMMYFSEPKRTGLIIGFSNVQPEAIDSYIAKLAAAILQ